MVTVFIYKWNKYLFSKKEFNALKDQKISVAERVEGSYLLKVVKIQSKRALDKEWLNQIEPQGDYFVVQ